MRILLVVGCYPPGQCGVGDYSQKLAVALTDVPNACVGVMTSKIADRRREDLGRVDLIQIDKWTLLDLASIISKVRQWSPDLIHIQYPSLGFTSLGLSSLLPLACRLAGFNVVQTWHELHPIDKRHRLKSFLYFFLQKLGAVGVIFVRPNYLEQLAPAYRRLIGRVPHVVIPNASPLPHNSLDQTQRNTLRLKYLGRYKRLVVFFGFVHPAKGVDLIFDIANPSTDSVVIAGAMQDSTYMAQLNDLALKKGWLQVQVCFTGFLAPQDAANLLASADAVVLPFRDGSGEWNTSLHSALAQGTLVITTAIPPRGDQPEHNLYTAYPGDINGMRSALDRTAGRRALPAFSEDKWRIIASLHVNFYSKFVDSMKRVGG